jgi:CBS domain-containing membrane protein
VLLASLAGGPSRISWGEGVRSTVAACVAVGVVWLASGLFLSGAGPPLLVASMGASAIILFGLSHSPLAQPWPVFGGHITSALVGVACSQLVASRWLAAALTVGLALITMLVLRCLHPPGGATALVPLLGNDSVRDLGFELVLAPVGVNAALLTIIGLVLNRWVLRRPYPIPAMPVRDERHKHADPRPLDRLGLRRQDLIYAMSALDTFVDITESDLDQIYRLAAMHAGRRRLGDVRCRDIMSRDIRSVTPGTDIEEAWALLRYHKVAILPVRDEDGRVIGTLGLVDILKRADLKAYAGAGERLTQLIRGGPDLADGRSRAVGEFMATSVVTAPQDMHVVDLVPLLSDQGLHHIPIVDERERLVGIVTQSDLIGALHAGCLGPRDVAEPAG